MIAVGRPSDRRGLADRCIGFIGGLCAALIEAPTCFRCRQGKAQSGWVVDPLGGIHGVCRECAGQR